MFPFNLPGPTALYLSLLIVTLAAHAMLAGYVLAGTGFVALSAGSRRPAARAALDAAGGTSPGGEPATAVAPPPFGKGYLAAHFSLVQTTRNAR